MKTIITILLTILGLNLAIDTSAQSLINSIRYELFYNIPSEPVTYDFIHQLSDSSYHIKARYKDKKDEKIWTLCNEIIQSKDTLLIKPLTSIIEQQEEFFIKEWASTWFSPRHDMFNSQYSILFSLELTRVYLIMQTHQWTPTMKYDYLKNLIELQRGDYDIMRVEKVLFVSDFLKNETHCLCLTSKFCGYSLLEMIIDEIKQPIFNEYRKISLIKINSFFHYYRFLNQKIAKIWDSELESIILNKLPILIQAERNFFIKAEERYRGENLKNEKSGDNYFSIRINNIYRDTGYKSDKLRKALISYYFKSKDFDKVNHFYSGELFSEKNPAVLSDILLEEISTEVDNSKKQRIMLFLQKNLREKANKSLLKKLKKHAKSDYKLYKSILSESK